jgi:hypothetical protein
MTRPTAPLQTMVDTELAGRGPALVTHLEALRAGQAARVPIGTVQAVEQAQPERAQSILLKDLREHNPEHQGVYWDDCEALYRGGHHLLRNDEVMGRLFPKHNAEMQTIYDDRKRRAFYLPYPGTIVDTLTAALEGDPVRLVADEAPDEDDEEAAADGADVGEVPAWWSRWCERVTAPGASLEHTYSLHGIVCEAIRAAQVKQSAWLLADLPRVDPAAAAAAAQDSLAAQEALGLRDPYLCLVDASEVIDWDQDEDGTLLYVWRHTTSRRRIDPTKRRDATVHTWTLYDAHGWARYELEVRDGQPPSPETAVALVDSQPHPFGVVPWVRFWFPDGLWTMGQLESIAREHFNKRCALSWAEFKSLFAILYEFLASPQQPGSGAVRTVGGGADDPNRAINQIRGQGWTQRRGKDDRAEFIGPDTAPFKEARESCAELMQEMHRVTRTMAASADMKSAALQRSAESKADDRTDEEKVLQAFGLRGRRLAIALMDLVAAGRGERRPEGVRIQGLESFDVEGIQAGIAAAVELFAGVPILSATFKRSVLTRLYAKIMALGDDASPEEIKAMRQEVRTAVSQEDVLLGMGPGGIGGSLGGGKLPPQPEPPGGAEGGGKDVDASGPARKVKPKGKAPGKSKGPAARTMYSSG